MSDDYIVERERLVEGAAAAVTRRMTEIRTEGMVEAWEERRRLADAAAGTITSTTTMYEPSGPVCGRGRQDGCGKHVDIVVGGLCGACSADSAALASTVAEMKCPRCDGAGVVGV